jgi:glycosyltransferase involved in cell wall biosynthesis
MNILIECRYAIIPTKTYGGIERVIWYLGKELDKLGHQVYYLVDKTSVCNFATVIPYDASKSIESHIPDFIDVIHFNRTPTFKVKKPYVVTIHTNPPEDENLSINTVFISKNHAKRYGSEAFVYNGIDWSEYPQPNIETSRSGFHFLGKAAWKLKNVFGAAKIAVAANEKLHVLGGKRFTFRNFKRGFKYVLSSRVIFHGMVDNQKKINVAENSKALIFPVIWNEPFGIAIIESLYAGCAVFGTKAGALEELITPEVGVTSNSYENLITAAKSFNYNPKKCHQYAVNTFNAKAMALGYIAYYNAVLAGDTVNPITPKYVLEYNTVPKIV